MPRAIAAARPPDPLRRGLACLRLHQMTGEMRWVTAARRVAASANGALPDLGATLLAIELEAPGRAMAPLLQAGGHPWFDALPARSV